MMSQAKAPRESCAERTMRTYDAGAILLLGLAVPLAWIQPATRGGGGAGWMDVALSLTAATVMIGSLIVAMIRRKPEGDEYLRRTAGIAAGIGFFATFALYVVWMPLAPGILPRPSADHLIAALLASTSIGWFVAKSR